MSQIKEDDEEEPACVFVISDSDDGNPLDNGFAGFPSAKKKYPPVEELIRDQVSAPKKLKFDGGGADTTGEITIDIDSISELSEIPRRTRTKVSSDTSSKFPVSSPSDCLPIVGQRKKYVKNTLPAGAFERMLADITQRYPLMTYRDKLDQWNCSSDLSDVEDVNNFDDQFTQRELKYKKNTSGKRTADKVGPCPNYNYQHFRTVILESLKGSPISYSPSRASQRRQNNQNNVDQPSCSKEQDVPLSAVKNATASKLDPTKMIHYEKVICPSSESSMTKASPSIHLHWTDEESVFRFNRLNPEIDKFSRLIKMRIDYKKQINLKAKMNEVFKTPSVPQKYNVDASEQRNTEGNTVEESSTEVPSIMERRIETRRSTSGRSGSDSRRSTERKSMDRVSTEKLPEVNSFQQDEFCTYLGLGMNGKVYSPTPTDNKRRSLRVKRLQQQMETEKKRKEMKEHETSKDSSNREKLEAEVTAKKKEDEVTTTFKDPRSSLSSPISVKLQRSKVESKNSNSSPRTHPQSAPFTADANKKPSEIKILLQICSSPTPTTAQHTPSTARQTPSSATTPNSAASPIRRIRLSRATSNGTSTCPRSSQSDESPSKVTPRQRRLHHHARRINHRSDLSESQLSDLQQHEISSRHNGRASEVPSSEGRKDEITSTPMTMEQSGGESLHKKFQRYLEESRKTKPSIFIVEAIESVGSRAEAQKSHANPNNSILTEQAPKNVRLRAKQWPKKRKIIRRLLRRNGSIGGTLNQRILRNRKVLRPLRITKQTTKHKKMRTIDRKVKDESTPADVSVEGTQVSMATEEAHPAKETVEFEDANVIEGVDDIETIETVDPIHVDEHLQQPPLPEKPEIEDAQTQTEPCPPQLPITFLTAPSSRMANPLSSENGRVLYVFYELDILTVVQDMVVTFWKTSRLIQVLSKSTCEWVFLGECMRLCFDEEIQAPYKNRICVHNSIPIYMEMRAKELSKIRRDCNAISVYINLYYYHDEDLVAKSHSIQLDTVASLPQNVIFTTISNSRYFVMCWSQETILGKSRSGLCKYSLTPHLDTLASIREFKSMRHEIRYLECTTDDNLIGFGDTQVTIWDHRSGDILMNYDLDIKLGTNVGSIYYSSLDVGQDNTVLIFQKTSLSELNVIAINISHNSPSCRSVCKHSLPADFEDIHLSMRTDDYVILTNANHQELWIDCSDPMYMMQIKTPEGQRRFYSRYKSNVIDIGATHLALESFSNFGFKMINASVK